MEDTGAAALVHVFKQSFEPVADQGSPLLSPLSLSVSLCQHQKCVVWTCWFGATETTSAALVRRGAETAQMTFAMLSSLSFWLTLSITCKKHGALCSATNDVRKRHRMGRKMAAESEKVCFQSKFPADKTPWK